MANSTNKALVKSILTGAVGSLDHWASDGEWTIVGTTRWSGTYRGKAAIGAQLLRPLSAEIEHFGVFHIDNVVAEGNFVVVQGRAEGRVTKTGQPYDNTYSLVYEIVVGPSAGSLSTATPN